ncbi:MAG: hypothetical protein GXP55_18465 [Deltaproteobacteria bacterium]|nr:hypothetical protein [Deltaproteobacteria bacterium]
MRDDTLATEFRSQLAVRARGSDRMQGAEAARRRAAQASVAGDEDAANDYRTEARLLLEAAETEVETRDLERERRAAERREEAATTEAVRLETTREEEARDLARELAGDLAREQARQAFTQAEEDEARRTRRNAGPVAAARRRAAASLSLRARLVLAAAEAMGAPSDQVDALRASLAVRATDPVRALSRADDALSRALTLLGQARAAQPGDVASERASLEAAAQDRGFVLEARPEGLVVRAPSVFPRAARPNAARLAHVLDLVRAHPRGPIAVTLSGTGALARRQRAAILRAYGVDPPSGLRFEVSAPSAASPAGSIELLFFAFTR